MSELGDWEGATSASPAETRPTSSPEPDDNLPALDEALEKRAAQNPVKKQTVP
jgi:hypothetical protein